MRAEREAEFSAFVAARWSPLLRSATLLAGDRSAGEDLLQTALAKLWFAWPRVRDGAPEAYVRRILANTASTNWRRRWRGERPTSDLPELTGTDTADEVLDRETLRRALTQLSPRQRAVIVLRYFDDLTEAETADLLGCSTGTVKTLASRALAKLRAVPGLDAPANESLAGA